jgi:site-specific recombinase XerD
MQYSKRRKDIQQASTDESRTKTISFDRALEIFLKAHDGVGHSKETYKDYKRVIGIFMRYIIKTCEYTVVNDVTESDIYEWMAYLRNVDSARGRPYSSRSIQTYLRDVRVFFSWLAQHGHLDINPFAGVEEYKAEKVLIRVFTEDELEKLNVACDRAGSGKSLTPDERKALASRDRAFLWLLLSTGIRLSEACGLLFSDVDWNEGMIYVRGKGAKERRIPFGKVARQHLNTYITYWRGTPGSSDDHVFLNAFGQPIRSSSAQAIFARLKKVAGITDKRVSAHTCRHWFAVNCIKNGMPTVVLKNLLGHENWDMIEVYVRLAEQDNKDLYDRYSPVDTLTMHNTSKDKREELRHWRNSRKQRKPS